MKQTNTYTTPKMHDKVVQAINESLASLTYIDYFYPIVHLSYDEEGNTFPSVYMNDGTFDNYMVFPDNRVRAFVFFEMDEGGLSNIALDEDSEFSLALIFWGNLETINTIKRYDYTSEIINDIGIILGGMDAYDMTYSTETDEIFDKYSLYKEQEKQTLLRPYTGFKVTFKMKGDALCWTDQSPISSDMINTEIDQGTVSLVANVNKTVDLNVTFTNATYTVDGRAYDVNGNTILPTLISRTTTEFVIKANKACTFDWTAILKL